MLKKTLLATTAIAAMLFAVAAVLPVIPDSFGGGHASPPVAAARTFAQAPAQDVRKDGGGAGPWKTERRQDARHDDRHDDAHRKEHDRDRD